VRPVKIVNRLHYFDFGQVASAKFLHDLVERGVPVAQIRESLHAIETWYPAAGRSLLQLGMMERDGRLLVRLDDGSLADPNGQLHFAFSQPAQTPSVPFSVVELDPDQGEDDADAGSEDEDGPEDDLFGLNPDPSGSWFEIAVELEEAGRLPQAAEAYQRALAVDGPSAEVAFNLGNVLYGLGRREEAVQRFLQAVESDPSYIEAWNNLANALFDIGRREEAVRALRKALAVNPRYADAHYNLAEVLHDLGRMDEACAHWRAYLEQDPSSSWADLVRDRLSDFED
jgi:tetratricopeptide (TPR) repeat protein